MPTPEEQAILDADAAAAAAAAGDPPADPPAPPVDPPAPEPAVDPRVAALDAKIDAQTELLNKLLEKSQAAPGEPVWTIEKLEEAEAKCHAGEYDMKYLPKITTLKATLAAREVAAETTTKLTKESNWQDINAKWDKGLVDASAAFGAELVGDHNSKLFKTAQAILHQDPGFRRYAELKAKGVELSNIDPTLIDPNLQFKCFEIAAARLGIPRKDAPPNPAPPAKPAKSALAGQSLPTNESGKSELERLEARAVQTGEPQDWIALDKARLRLQKDARR